MKTRDFNFIKYKTLNSNVLDITDKVDYTEYIWDILENARNNS